MSKNAVQLALLIMFAIILFSGLRNTVIASGNQEQSGVGTVIVVSIFNFEVTYNEVTYDIITSSTSAISNFTFSQSLKMISFNVTGAAGTTGFCNITFLTQLLGGPYTTLIDGSPVIPVETNNATFTLLYFTYTHSAHKVEISGTTVIPEYPTMIVAAILFTVLTLTLVLTRGRLKHH